MPKLSDKAAQKKFGMKLLLAILVLIAAFSLWYYLDRSKQVENTTPAQIISEERN